MSKASVESSSVVGRGDGAFSRALQEASANALEKHQKDIREKFLELHRETYGTATAYDKGVILAGYVAFFALWASSSQDVSQLCRLLTVALMGGSLLLYIGWHIAQMIIRQFYEFRCAEIIAAGPDPSEFNKRWLAALQDQDLATARLLRFWPFVFVPSIVLGFAGGIILTYNALAIILGWPELTG